MERMIPFKCASLLKMFVYKDIEVRYKYLNAYFSVSNAIRSVRLGLPVDMYNSICVGHYQSGIVSNGKHLGLSSVI